MSTSQPRTPHEVTFIRPMTHHDANGLGNVHGGVIMHQVDTAAGTAAARHARRPAVTASIDELSFFGPVHVGELLIVRARVNAVWKTSMEVGVRVEAETADGEERRHTTSAYLVFVALDEHGRPTEVPPLELVSELDHQRHHEAEIRRQARLERRDRVRASRNRPTNG